MTNLNLEFDGRIAANPLTLPNCWSDSVDLSKPEFSASGTQQTRLENSSPLGHCLPKLDIDYLPERELKLGLPVGSLIDKSHPVILTDKPELARAVNNELGLLFDAASRIPPGKYEIASAMALAEAFGLKPEKLLADMGLQKPAELAALLKNIRSIEKTADGRYVIEQNAERSIPLNIKHGSDSVDAVHVGKTFSFKLEPNSNRISDIQGVSMEGHGGFPHRRLDFNLEQVQITKDGSGGTMIQTQLSNPEHPLERVVTGDHGRTIGLDIHMQKDGKIVISQNRNRKAIA